MIVFESRASVVLYKYLIFRKSEKCFLLPANICPIVPITFLKAKVPFDFVDISHETLCIDENLVLNQLRSNPEKYGGVLFSHTYGTEYSPIKLKSARFPLNPRLTV